MTRRHAGTHQAGSAQSAYADIIHRDLDGWIVRKGAELGWSDHFIGLARNWATLVTRGQASDKIVANTERDLKNLSNSTRVHRGGFGKLKSAFRDACHRHENRRGDIVLFGQHRHQRLFPRIFGTRREQRQLKPTG